MSLASIVTLDNVSPNVTYMGNWTMDTKVPDQWSLYNNTDAWSNEQGATCILTFYGTYIEYWGNTEDTRGPCQLTLDGSDVGVVNAFEQVSIGQPKQLYKNSNLDLGDHTLSIQVQGASAPNRCEVDSFIIGIASAAPESPSSSPPTPPAPVPSTSTGSAVSSQTTEASSPTGTNSRSTQSNTSVVIAGSPASPLVSSNSIPSSIDASVATKSSSSALSAGAIAGTVLGILALNLLFVLLWWYLRSRRTKSTPLTDGEGSRTQILIRTERTLSSDITPFYYNDPFRSSENVSFPPEKRAPWPPSPNLHPYYHRPSPTPKTSSSSSSDSIAPIEEGRVKGTSLTNAVDLPSGETTETAEAIGRASLVTVSVPPAYTNAV